MLGTIEVIDAHCHIYPEKIAARAVEGTDKFYGTKACHSGTAAGVLSVLEKGRIDRALVHSVATTPKQVQSINAFIAREVEQFPHRFFGFGTLHPSSSDQKGDLEHLLELGLRGVKLHPDIQAFPMDSAEALEICRLCAERNVPLLIHTGDHRFDFSNPNRLLPVLKEFPNLTVIGAHLGGWSVWEEACDKMASMPNLFVDCSSTFPFYPPEKAKELILRWGTDRVLFGSDYPMWDPEKELDTLLSLDLGEEALRQILSGNAKKLFSL